MGSGKSSQLHRETRHPGVTTNDSGSIQMIKTHEVNSMSFTQKVRLVAVSVILTLGLASLYACSSQQKIIGADDDAAIMIAGGSLYLGTPHANYRLNADANDPQVLWFADPNGNQVARVIYGL